jgi:hypothetical protein
MRARARVTWLSSSEGGRSPLPGGRRYVTIGKFPEDGPNWPDGGWSVVLEFDTPPSVQGSPSIGVATFLMDTAPHDRLRDGQRFELFEGLRRVAVVEVIAEIS